MTPRARSRRILRRLPVPAVPTDDAGPTAEGHRRLIGEFGRVVVGLDESADVVYGFGLVFVAPGSLEFGGVVSRRGMDRHRAQRHHLFHDGNAMPSGQCCVAQGRRSHWGTIDECHPLADLEGPVEMGPEQVSQGNDVAWFAVSAGWNRWEVGFEQVQ